MLDTNICIFLLRGKYNVDQEIDKVGFDNCFISEITVAELKFKDFRDISNIRLEIWIRR